MTKPRKADPKHARDERLAKARANPRPEENGPPHSFDAERAALGCVLMAANLGSQQEADEMLRQLRPAQFYDARTKLIFEAMRELRADNHAIDEVMLLQWFKDRNLLENIGGVPFLADLADKAPGLFAFPGYLATLKDKALRRWGLAKSVEMSSYFGSDTVTLDDARARLGELFEATDKATTTRGELKLWRVNDLARYTPDRSLALVGDNEIRKGYEGVTLLAGPGSSGKSLAVSSLALAGAIGSGQWMGRTVHRQFRTLIIQAENGATRLKKEVEALQAKHPGINLHDFIIISDPPEGGIPFHKAEFRASVRRHVETLKPDLVIIDPWSHVAVEDAAKDVVDKIAEIRSCFPPGDSCPALLIVAHTKKPRAEDVKKGRALAYLISGSVALVNTARCVFMLLPWSEDVTDDRIYWSCCKLNDGAMYPPSVWRRRFGTFFEHDGETDPTQWGEEPDEDNERRAVTREMLVTVFKETKRPGMKRGELVRALVARFELAESTVWRALKGYGAEWVDTVAGVVALKKWNVSDLIEKKGGGK